MSCFIKHPPLPKPKIKTSKGVEQRLKVKILEEAAMVISRMNPDLSIVEELQYLPTKPSTLCPWKNALIVPAESEGHQALVFFMGTYRWIWLLDERSHLGWKKSAEAITENIVLSSLEINPEPHDTFLKECLRANEIEKTGKGMIPENTWPPLLHLKWLEVLTKLEIKDVSKKEINSFKEEKEKAIETSKEVPNLTSSNIDIGGLILFPMGGDDTKTLIKTIKKGIIIAMALRAPEELRLAREVLIRSTGCQPTDNTWKSLLELV
jgi:hypothetical protein